jgi:hypothetical protein
MHDCNAPWAIVIRLILSFEQPLVVLVIDELSGRVQATSKPVKIKVSWIPCNR